MFKKRPRCPSCNKAVIKNAKRCWTCGVGFKFKNTAHWSAELGTVWDSGKPEPVRCTQCNAMLKRDSQQCESCGVKLIWWFQDVPRVEQPKQPATKTKPRPEPEPAVTSRATPVSEPATTSRVTSVTSKPELPPQDRIDLGNIDQKDAVDAAEGGLSSWRYKRKQRREAENMRASVQADEAMTKVLQTKTERIKATKELLSEAGQTDKLPEKERKEGKLGEMKLETEMTRLKREQAELEKQIRELEVDESSSPVEETPSEEEKYAKAMEEEQRRFEQQLAAQAAQEMRLIQRLTERAEFLMKWQEKIRTEYPEIADEIIETFERIQMESD